jgi:DNA-binding CsgD family transcriptional regulator
LSGLGDIACARGDMHAAVRLHRESLSLFEEVEGQWDRALALDRLGVAIAGAGNAERGAQLLERSIALSRQSSDRLLTARALTHLGVLELAGGRHVRAAELIEEALGVIGQLGARAAAIEALDAISDLLLKAGEARRSAVVLGTAENLRSSTGAALAERDQRRHAVRCEGLQTALGADGFQSARLEGRALPFPDAIAFALRARTPAVDTSPPPVTAPPSPARMPSRQTLAVAPRGGALTQRELEVARLIARGATNRDIADSLVIGERTVETHVHHVLVKLELRSRFQVADWAAEHDSLN